MTELRVSRDLDDASLSRYGDVAAQALGFSRTDWDPYVALLGRERLRAIHDGPELVGGLALFRAGQWFGGRSVPLAGVAAVAVAPEQRGRGVAARLVGDTLAELAREGVPIATLYASSVAVYRKVGFELAGSRCQFAAPAADFPVLDRTLAMTAVEPVPETLRPLHARRAASTAGQLDRDPALWHRIVRRRPEDVYAYLVGEPGAPEGYIVYYQSGGQHYDVVIRDLVALTSRAARRLWTFLADHRSMATDVVWTGPVNEPLLHLLPEQTTEVRKLERWLLRIVDVERALVARGWPADGELHLEVDDPLLPANHDRFVLRVSGGRAEVTRGGRGELQLDVRTLAPLYTGLQSPASLAVTGRLSATPAALDAAARLFAGPEPWMTEIF